MCRLLGVIANRPVDLQFSLERFEKFSIQNPDGWGIGWFEGDDAKVFKQGFSASVEKSDYKELSKHVVSKIIITHVRKATEGHPSDQNAHPFKFDNWIFAHNGGVDREHLLPLLKTKFKNKLKGETDSEVYFYWILQCIEQENDIVYGIKLAISKIVPDILHSGLNFLMSDGESLYSFKYSDQAREYYTLYRLNRDPDLPGPISFESEETKVLLHSKSLKGESAVLVCSEELTKEDWEDIRLGNLTIIDENLQIKDVEIL